NAVKSWFPNAFNSEAKPFPADPILQHTFNGLLTLADWLGSDPTFFSFADSTDNYIETARANSTCVVEKLVLDTQEARLQLSEEPVQFNCISDFEPYNIQQQCLDLPVHKEGSLTVLESDTGSGKTEAALARF